MLRITYSRIFLRNMKKRLQNNRKLQEQFQKRVNMFLSDRSSLVLKDHALVGSLKGYRAFSLSGDWRIVYKLIDDENVVFYDIGTHTQVYG